MISTKTYRCLLDHNRDAIRPLTKGESEWFIMLNTIGLQDSITIDTIIQDLNQKSMGFKILYGRYNAARDNLTIKAEVDPALLAFLGVTVPTAGIAVMWAYSCLLAAQERGGKYTMDDWAHDFPFGIPTDDEMHRIWDAQKHKYNDRMDNWLDLNEWKLDSGGA